MKRMMLVLAALFVSMSATSAFALDLCVINTFGQLYKFDTVRLLKNKTTPLTGRFHFSGGNDNKPIFGSVTLDTTISPYEFSFYQKDLPFSSANR